MGKYCLEVITEIVSDSRGNPVTRHSVGNTGLAVELTCGEAIMSFLPGGKLSHYKKDEPENALVVSAGLGSLREWIGREDENLQQTLANVRVDTTEPTTKFTRRLFGLSTVPVIISDEPYRGELPYLRQFRLDLTQLGNLPVEDPLVRRCNWAMEKLIK